jgi:peptide-methionine (S)-S-oxide reductase
MSQGLAVLGGGCFWCLEAVFQQLPGVTQVTSGYAGGDHPEPTYHLVCGGGTGHAEVVRISFNPEIISYRSLLEILFVVHDPTTRNRQGADVGKQYRSIILVADAEQRATAEDVIRALATEGRWSDPVVTEIRPLGAFFPAEPEHDDYYRRNSSQPYCQVVISPKVMKAHQHFTSLFVD